MAGVLEAHPAAVVRVDGCAEVEIVVLLHPFSFKGLLYLRDGQPVLAPNDNKVLALVLHWAHLLFLGVEVGSDGATANGTRRIESYLFLIQKIFEIDQHFFVLILVEGETDLLLLG